VNRPCDHEQRWEADQTAVELARVRRGSLEAFATPTEGSLPRCIALDQPHTGSMKPVDTVGISIEQTTGAPLVLLREHDEPHRVLPIFIGGLEATAIVAALQGVVPPRPLTFDLMAAIVDQLGAHLERVEITELREGTFIAELAVVGPAGRHRIDTRPSDAIALALRVGAQVFVNDMVLDEAGVVLAESSDEVVDEDEVEKFRAFIADLDPADFSDG